MHHWNGEALAGATCGSNAPPTYCAIRWDDVTCSACLEQRPSGTVRIIDQTSKPHWLDVALWGEVANGLLDEIADMMKERQTKYGPGNISRHGVNGILVRLDDKIARLSASTDDFADERYEDAWKDVVGYGLIALMWLRKQWPGSEV